MNPDLNKLDYSFMSNNQSPMKKSVQNELFFIDETT